MYAIIGRHVWIWIIDWIKVTQHYIANHYEKHQIQRL